MVPSVAEENSVPRNRSGPDYITLGEGVVLANG